MKAMRRHELITAMAAGAIAMAIWMFLCLTTIYSSDDYWYSTFWDHGIARYLELMIYHYETMNGRVLVHLAAHGVLALGNLAFGIMCLACCLLVPALVSRAEEMSWSRCFSMAVGFLIAVLLLPRQILNQGVFWISGACNYLLPVSLVCILVIMLEKDRHWAWAMAFLCGATTEQMGLTTIVLCGVYLLDALLRKKTLKNYAQCTAAAVIGVLTVFLSPATAQRTAKGVKLGGLSEMASNLSMTILKEISRLSENPVPLLIMLALLIAMAVSLGEKNAKKWTWGISAAGCFGLIAGAIGTEPVRLAGYVLGAVMLAVLAVSMIVQQQRLIGVLVLGALSSAAVMAVTNVSDSRVMLPSCYLFLMCICLLLSKRIRTERSAALLLSALTAVTVICIIPVMKGYVSNYQTDMLNRQMAVEAKKNNCIRYCTDYDYRYTWVKANHDPYFRMKYLESCGFDENAGVIFFSRSDLNPHMLYFGEKAQKEGVLTDEQGKALLPLRRIVEHMGGSVSWENGITTIRLDQKEYRLEDVNERTLRLSWSEESGQRIYRDFAACTYYTHTKYCEIDMFTQILKIPVYLDQERFCYVISE